MEFWGTTWRVKKYYEFEHYVARNIDVYVYASTRAAAAAATVG